jgi:hypothetical protein
MDSLHTTGPPCCAVVLLSERPTNKTVEREERTVIDPRPGLDGASFDSTDSKAAACSTVGTGLITGWDA